MIVTCQFCSSRLPQELANRHEHTHPPRARTRWTGRLPPSVTFSCPPCLAEHEARQAANQRELMERTERQVAEALARLGVQP